MITVRPPETKADWADIRRICCETAYGGAGLEEPSRRNFFGQMWIGPYQQLLPNWTLLVRDNQEVIGYLTGCPNTVAFEWRRLILHDWSLAARIVFGEFPANQDTRSFLRRYFGLEQPPNRRFSKRSQDVLRQQFPAHLHMNLTEKYRGQGIGQRLLDEYSGRLSEARVPGLHVHCGQAPLGFYQKAGLTLLERQQLPDGKYIFILTRDLT